MLLNHQSGSDIHGQGYRQQGRPLLGAAGARKLRTKTAKTRGPNRLHAPNPYS
jgi:hypothetical protein